MDMFIYIKMDAECNETTRAIAFPRFHEDSEMFTKKDVKKVSGRSQIVKCERNKDRYGISDLCSWRPLRLFL